VIAFSPTDQDRQRLADLAVQPPADDGRDWTGYVVEKPWGHEMQVRQTKDFAATRLEMMAGGATSMHCHPNKTVVLLVERGAVEFRTLAAAHRLERGAAALVEKGVFHRLCAQDGGAAVIEIEWPPNKFDLVRLEDAYGRGQGYVCA
jgi:quercetin dioxygenase-like cupin family protein